MTAQREVATSTVGHGGGGRGGLAAGALGALGIVYGDIGTSPLYAFRETFAHEGATVPVTPENVLGALSLIFWALLLVISVKYLVVVMRADNDGEGGILTLTSLVRPQGREPRRLGGRWALISLGLFGTALLYGDGMITPAISVLSAVEGTELVAPGLRDAAVPIAVVILVGLFAIQRRGTATIGKLFGPVMLVWFAVLAALGLGRLLAEPGVLAAVNPLHGIRFFADNGFVGFLALGSIFLVVTGGEALYADMGHFGRQPIQVGWYSVALPALLLNYFGQGALLIQDPSAIESPFFRLAPSWAVLPLVGLATLATVIASQALISGVFSLTLQAVQMGYAPRVRIVHTSPTAFGQIYVPAVNWGLMAACVALVVGFGSSSALAAAYGVAVTSTMLVTTLLLFFVLRERFHWSLPAAAGLCVAFGVVDVAFLGASLFKIPDGGWFPLVVAAVVFTLMTTWRRGRRLVSERVSGAKTSLAVCLGTEAPPDRTRRVPGTAVYLYGRPGLAPPALLVNLRHNHVLHEHVVVLSVLIAGTPRVVPEDRITVRDVSQGVRQVEVRFGFMEDPDIPAALRDGGLEGLTPDAGDVTYFVGAEALTVTDRPGMAEWREHLFHVMTRNATPASVHFGLPVTGTVVLSEQVEL